jgi:hypothetical protein
MGDDRRPVDADRPAEQELGIEPRGLRAGRAKPLRGVRDRLSGRRHAGVGIAGRVGLGPVRAGS